MRLPVDLRLTTPLFGNLPISKLVRRLMPATIAAAAVVVASGLALAAPAPDVLLATTLVRAKFVLLALALINAWYLHAVTARTIEQWDTVDVTPVAARISAVLSLTLWAAIVVSSLLAPFWLEVGGYWIHSPDASREKVRRTSSM